jgi:hypothetical protein
MIRKIGMWTLYVLVVGLLVFGAINRSQAKSDQIGNQSPGITSESGSIQIKDKEVINSEDYQAGNTKLDSYSEDHVWVELVGTINMFDNQRLVIQVEDDEIIEITGRAWKFAQESGYSPAEGNLLGITGFFESGEFKIATITDYYSGVNILLRHEDGKPLWGGKGNP